MGDAELIKELRTRRLNRDGTVERLCSVAADRIEELLRPARKALEAIANGYLGDQTSEQQFVWAQETARNALRAMIVKEPQG